MSEKFKFKYEVAAILKENILKGLESFGLPLSETPGDGAWTCFESDQSAYRNADNAILFWHEHSERIGWQGDRKAYNPETESMEVVDYFIEQQTWKIKILCKSTTEEITDESIPMTSEDVACLMMGWFNRLGCMEFRKHNMANLYIQMKDIKSYKDKSDVQQWATEFPIKIQVVKQFETEMDSALPKYGGAEVV